MSKFFKEPADKPICSRCKKEITWSKVNAFSIRCISFFACPECTEAIIKYAKGEK